MSKQSTFKKAMVESGKVTPTSFANDPMFPSPDFVLFLEKYNYLAETLNVNIDPIALLEEIKNKKGELFESYQKITEAELKRHNKQIIAESKSVKDLKAVL